MSDELFNSDMFNDSNAKFLLEKYPGTYSLYYANNIMSTILLRNNQFEINGNLNNPNIDVWMIGCQHYNGPLSILNPEYLNIIAADGFKVAASLSSSNKKIELLCSGIYVYKNWHDRKDFRPYFDRMPNEYFDLLPKSLTHNP